MSELLNRRRHKCFEFSKNLWSWVNSTEGETEPMSFWREHQQILNFATFAYHLAELVEAFVSSVWMGLLVEILTPKV